MSGHWTPGPWCNLEARVYCASAGPVDPVCVADCDVDTRVRDTAAEANARLIAAAPELLQAGKHLAVKLAEVYRAAGAAPADCQALRDWMAAVTKAQGRAAIAKVEQSDDKI